MKELLNEIENKLDYTNLSDVMYAVTSLFDKLEEYHAKADKFKKEEYGLYIFYTNNLINNLKSYPEEKEDIFSTVHGMILSCIEVENTQ